MNMLTQEDNDLLCYVEDDAPVGQLMRHHWLPVCLVEEVPEPDCAPVRARVLGEKLVVFRDSDGRIGVLDEHCPHRRASLVFGRNEDCGLRCLYHGWKFDVDGNVLEMTAEPQASGLIERTKHRAYPAKEWGGMVWGWFGERGAEPEFSPPLWAPTADTRVAIAKALLPCNWAQVLEGAIDSAHSSSLHSSDMVPAPVGSAEATATKWLRPSTDRAPRLQAERTPYGFRYAALRRPIRDSASKVYVRSSVFVAPSTVLIPPNNLYNVANINVPMDNRNTAFYFIAWGHPSQAPETETWRRFLRQTVGIDLDDQYRPLRTIDNNFLQDREAMKAGNFTGISGFPNQDIAMWVSMGPVADRPSERLGGSDLAIVEFRRRMLDAIKNFQHSGTVIGTGESAPRPDVCAFQQIIPKTTDWRRFEATSVWLSNSDSTQPDCSEEDSGSSYSVSTR